MAVSLAGLAWRARTSATSGGVSATVAAAGDVSCDPADRNFNGGSGTPTACRMEATAALVESIDPDAVLLLGDVQYEDGAPEKYVESYEKNWGRFKDVTRPAVGNHEYLTPEASGYFDYFGSAAGRPDQGWYSYNIGAWHLIALNSNCSKVGGCQPGSPQERWLRADLAANTARCTLAYWHHSRFSSGQHGNSTRYDSLWEALDEAGADLVLTAHDHDYERFAPQDADGKRDQARGIRQFVVGTGGRNTRPFTSVQPNSEFRLTEMYGVLELTLRPDSYRWQFVTVDGGAVADEGTGKCR